MNILTRMIAAALVVFGLTGDARAQVVGLLVGSGESGFSGVDYYASTNGSYQGVFASGFGPNLNFFKFGGPSNNLFAQSGSSVLQFNGQTGNFINTFISQAGGQFAFGPDNNLYRLGPGTPKAIDRFNGVTGAFLDTFVPANMSGLNSAGGGMRFGPDGDLYVDNGSTILQFDGITGAPMGPFIPPVNGGTAAVNDAVFASNGDLIVTATIGGANDQLFRFNGTTGAYLGLFASGNGLNVPIGIAQGPDGAIFVASTFSDQIKRYDLSTGAFLGDFVSNTAHMFPNRIAFSPTPIPEPGSLLLCALGCSVITRFAASRQCRRMSIQHQGAQ